MKSAVLAVCCMAAVAGAHAFQRAYGGEMEDYGYSARQAADGGYIIVGKTQSYGAGGNDVWLVRTDERGDTMWTRTYGGENSDWGYSVAQTMDSGYIIVGSTQSYGAGGSDVWLLKTDASGDTLWTRTYGDTLRESGSSVQQCTDGGYIIVGSTQSYGAGESDAWLVRTDALGDTMWTRTYGGENSDWGYSVAQTMDSGYTVAGFTESFGAGNADVWLLKTDSMGDTAWTRTYGGSAADRGHSVDKTTDSGYVIVGHTGVGGDVWLIKTDRDGGTMWTRTFGGERSDDGWSVEQTADGGYIIAGHTMSFGAGWTDVWLIKTDSAGLIAVEEPGMPRTRRAEAATIVSGVLRFRPTANSAQSAAVLLDLAGRRVMSLQPGINDIRHVAPGVYFLRSADSGGRSAVRKVIIQR